MSWDVTDVTGGKKVSVKSLTIDANGDKYLIQRDPAAGTLSVQAPGQGTVNITKDNIDTWITENTDNTDLPQQVMDIIKREFPQVIGLGVVMVQAGDGKWYVSPLRTTSDVMVSLLKGLEPDRHRLLHLTGPGQVAHCGRPCCCYSRTSVLLAPSDGNAVPARSLRPGHPRQRLASDACAGHEETVVPNPSPDSFSAADTLTVASGGQTESYRIHRIKDVPGLENATKLPFSLKILLENLVRTEDGANITAEHIRALANWDPDAQPDTEIQFTPARVIMQDFTGVPCVVDLATMREAMADLGGDPDKINPLAPAEMVIDHSVIADIFGRADAFERNVELEYERNRERYQFLRWGQTAFDEFKVVPPGTGIVHQVNIEHLARVVMVRGGVAYPDTLVGTDSHTTMVNGLGVLGWGVGGIEAEAAMLGQPVSMLIPRVVGFKLTGSLPAGTTATDLVLTITEMLRKHGVVGKFVEFYGDGVAAVPLANRATIGNMSPEFGSTAAIFPIDDETINYLRLTGRSESVLALVEAYAKAQGLWHDPAHEAVYSEYLALDLSTIVPSIAGPKRPQDRVELADAVPVFREGAAGLRRSATSTTGSTRRDLRRSRPPTPPPPTPTRPTPTDTRAGSLPPAVSGRASKPTPVSMDGQEFELDHGHVVIAAITSCTNTSNPQVMLGAALLAKKAVERGLSSKPWVKTTLAPGSKVVMNYYERAGLVPYLEKLGFNLVGFGCTTCIGNSGPLPDRDLGGGQRGRPRGGVRAVRQPQLRGPDQP